MPHRLPAILWWCATLLACSAGVGELAEFAAISNALWQFQSDHHSDWLADAVEGLHRLRPTATGPAVSLALGALYKDWLRGANARGRALLLANATAFYRSGLRELGCATATSDLDATITGDAAADAGLRMLSRLDMFHEQLRCSTAYENLLTLHQVQGHAVEAAELIEAVSRLPFATNVAPSAERCSLAQLALRDTGSLGGPDHRYPQQGAATLKPLWSVDEVPWLRALQVPVVLAELQAVASSSQTMTGDNLLFRPSHQNWNLPGRSINDWTSLSLVNKGQLDQTGCALVPETCAVLLQMMWHFSPVKGVAEETGARLYKLAPGAVLRPHFGPGGRLVAHLGVKVPHGSRLYVADQVVAWEEGKFVVFDDAYLHWAKNEAETARFILHLTFPHPGVRQAEEEEHKYRMSSADHRTSRELRDEIVTTVMTPPSLMSPECALKSPKEPGTVELHVERGSTKVPVCPSPGSHDRSSALRTMDIAGQVGECESAQIWLRSDGDMHNVTATMSNCSGEGGVSILPSAWEIFQQGYVSCRKAPPYEPSGGWHPDPLLEIPASGIARVPAGLAQPIFFTLCIARDTLPGKCSGRVTLAAAGGFTDEVNVVFGRIVVSEIEIPNLSVNLV
jgi:hypothetical protein